MLPATGQATSQPDPVKLPYVVLSDQESTPTAPRDMLLIPGNAVVHSQPPSSRLHAHVDCFGRGAATETLCGQIFDPKPAFGFESLSDRLPLMSGSPSADQQVQAGNVPNAVAGCPAPKVREIHIDFLLEEEFNANSSFLEHFIRAYKNHGGSFIAESVKRSVADQFGEADLVVLYKPCEGDANCTAILIEDKVGAGFQPDQPERYRQRGEYGIAQKWWQDYWTCLVAPQSYITEEATDGFDAVITLEKIKEWMAPAEPARHSFKAMVIQDAIRKADWLGPQEIDERVTQFRASYFCLLERFFADRSQHVHMRSPKPSWKGEVWFRIKSSLLPNGAYIHHKAPNGFVDLTFPDTDGGRLNAAGALLEKGMKIEQTGKSAAIRLQVGAITQFDSFERESVKVEEALASVERLLRFYVREHAHLDPILTSAATVPAK